MLTDPELAASVDVISNHTMTDVGTPESVKKLAKQLHKPIWNSEEHVYKDGFDCEISIVQAFNQNYVRDGVTKITNWYLVGSVYDAEPYAVQPSMLIANSPWSGSYSVREALWGYAHYGQFTKIGWEYLNGGCGNLADGGTYVTLKSPRADYSIIAETKDAKRAQSITFNVEKGLSKGKLCVWRSNSKEQFVRLEDVTPVNGAFTLTLDPDSVYSLSTTRGQRKGSFEIPVEKPFPFPYKETFNHYGDPKSWGYLPHYTADISGVFELADRPDGKGTCLKQVIDRKAQSWAPEWMPYTVIGDSKWKDYEVSVDVLIDHGGWAGVLGRVNNTGNGWYGAPKGYYLRLDSDGTVGIYSALQNEKNPAGEELAKGVVAGYSPKSWHNVKLQFSGSEIVGLVDGAQVVKAISRVSENGLAGLVTGGIGNRRNSAYFDNLTINRVNGGNVSSTLFPQDGATLYK